MTQVGQFTRSEPTMTGRERGIVAGSATDWLLVVRVCGRAVPIRPPLTLGMIGAACAIAHPWPVRDGATEAD